MLAECTNNINNYPGFWVRRWRVEVLWKVGWWATCFLVAKILHVWVISKSVGRQQKTVLYPPHDACCRLDLARRSKVLYMARNRRYTFKLVHGMHRNQSAYNEDKRCLFTQRLEWMWFRWYPRTVFAEVRIRLKRRAKWLFRRWRRSDEKEKGRPNQDHQESLL